MKDNHTSMHTSRMQKSGQVQPQEPHKPTSQPTPPTDSRARLTSKYASYRSDLRVPCPTAHVHAPYPTPTPPSQPYPGGTPGGKPQRLTARAKIARARLDRFWPGESLFDLSVCVSVTPCVPSVCPSAGQSDVPNLGAKAVRVAPSNAATATFPTRP